MPKIKSKINFNLGPVFLQKSTPTPGCPAVMVKLTIEGHVRINSIAKIFTCGAFYFLTTEITFFGKRSLHIIFVYTNQLSLEIFFLKSIVMLTAGENFAK